MSLLDTQASKYKLLYQQWSYLPLLRWLARGVLETPSIAGNCLCYCSWLLSRTWWQYPIVEDTTYFSHRIGTNQAGSVLEASCLLASFHSSRNCYLAIWWELWEAHHRTSVTTGLARYVYHFNSSTVVMRVINHVLIGYKTRSTRGNPYLALLLGPRTCTMIGHRLWGKFNAILLLNEHRSKPTPTILSPYQ